MIRRIGSRKFESETEFKTKDIYCEADKNFDDPKSWAYIAENPALVKLAQGLSESNLEAFNDALICIREACDCIDNANIDSEGMVRNFRDFMYLINHPEILTKCKKALIKRSSWIY